MAGSLVLRSTVSEDVSIPHSAVIDQRPPVPPPPKVDWEAVEREEARLARMVDGEPPLASASMASVSTAPGSIHRAPPAYAQPETPMDELQIPCTDGAFTMRYPRGMSPSDVDLVLPLVTAFLRRKRGPRTRKGKA